MVSFQRMSLLVGLFFALTVFASIASAQGRIVARLDFKPETHGFSFPNYKNEGDAWKDDLGVDDMIRMFGVRAVCKSGTNASNCVMEAAAREWLKRKLKAMDIGHCEGIAVASLRMMTELPFKRRTTPSTFQSNAREIFNLRRDQTLENYIAYYWITQTFDEVSKPTMQTASGGPVAIVDRLIKAMNERYDTYILGIWKLRNGARVEGHSVTPFAVEDLGNRYRLHVYDNNHPGRTRFLFVNKTGNQDWSYSFGPNQNNPAEYVGNLKSRTMEITGTSWRDGKCFDAPFAKDTVRSTGCGVESSLARLPVFTNASFSKTQDEDGEDAEFFLTGDGDMLVIDGAGRKLGYDPETEQFYNNQIPNGNARLLIGGFGEDAPSYTLPYEDTGEPYMIVFSGKNLDEESDFDFVFSAPGFTVGFEGIMLDPEEIMIATISHDGQEISFTASADGETPEVFFAFDPDEDDEASYQTLIGGVELLAEQTLFYDFDFEKGKLKFSDADGNEDKYDIELIRINADGTENVYEQEDVSAGSGDKFEMDFADWDGEGTMCFREDEEGDGFEDEQCQEFENEDDGENGN
jgi:hypothetical protein